MTPTPIRRHRDLLRRGMALVLVMVVLAALLVVATPFAVSMMFHEKTTRTIVDQTHAVYGAEAARSHAVALLAAGHTAAEAAKGAAAPYNTPDYDTLEEVAVTLDDPELRKVMEIDSPRGQLLGLTVRDEQGKVNLRSAPEELVERVKSHIGGRFANLRDYFTTHSGRDADWITPQRVRYQTLTMLTPEKDKEGGAAKGPPKPAVDPDTKYSGLLLDDASWYGPGTRVRISNGEDILYATVSESRGNEIVLDITMPDKYELKHAVIEAMGRHPINLNTAPREVLSALFEGISYPVMDPKAKKAEIKSIDTKTGNFLVDKILEKPLTGLEDYLKVLAAAREKDLISGEIVRSLLFNAINPNHRALGGTGTMPICFRSYDVYGIEAAGVRNSPSANQVSRHSFYEVVETAPRGGMAWSLASQKDFDQFLLYECGLALRSRIRGKLDMVGQKTSPFANGVVTWPNPSFAGQEPDSATGPDDGDVRLYPENDRRIKEAEHFQLFHEGLDLKKQGLAFDAPASIGAVEAPPPIPAGFVVPVGKGALTVIPLGWTIPPGAVEMWIKPKSLGSTATFLDLCYRENENHLWAQVASGTISVGCHDGSLEGSSAEVRVQERLDDDVWHHISAAWQSTRWGQMSLLLDGHPLGQFHYYDRSGRQIDGTIAAVDETTTTMNLQGGSLPPSGAVQIGAEIVEYGAGGKGGGLSNCVRGARGSVAMPHPAGTPVYPLGYSNPLLRVTATLPPPLNLAWDRIPVTRGTMAKDIGMVTSCELFNPANPRPDGGIMESDPIIPVQLAGGAAGDATADFPDRGYLLITGNAAAGTPVAEIVFYDAKIPGIGFNVGSNRGQTVLDIVTKGEAFKNGAKVHLFSIEVTDATGYSANNNVALFQVDDEWFLGRPGIMPGKVACWVGLRLPISRTVSGFTTFGDVPLAVADLGIGVPGRAIFGTTLAAHTTRAAVLPVFAVKYGNPPRAPAGVAGPCPSSYNPTNVSYDFGLVGKDDVVTLVAADQVTKEQATVKNGRAVRLGRTPAFLVALSAATTREYVSDAQGACRLLKFPSGELVSFINSQVTVCESSPNAQRGGARLNGTVDELKFYTGRDSYSVINSDLSATTPTFEVTEFADGQATDYSQQGGAVQIGNEVIAYRAPRVMNETTIPNPATPNSPFTIRVVRLEDVQRGYLRTAAENHNAGDLTLRHPGMAVVALGDDLAEDGAQIAVATGPNGAMGAGGFPANNGLPQAGFVLIDDEIVGYTQTFGPRLTMPTDPGDKGIYHGRYGTKAAGHSATAFAYALPIRYPDRYGVNAFDDTMSCYEISRRATGALWKRVTWTAGLPDPKLAIVALARVDGSPGWDAVPTNKPGGLFLFTDERAANALNARGDQVEVRFLFVYKDGAFRFSDLGEDAWKRTPAIKNVQIDYEQPVTPRFYETR